MPPDRIVFSRNHPVFKMFPSASGIFQLIAVTFDLVRLYDGAALRIVSA
jgi:hypothetical protein